MWVLLSTPTPDPYDFLMANHILGCRPANIFCKINQIAGKTTAKSVDAHVAGGGCLAFPYHSLTNPVPFDDHTIKQV